MRAVWTLTLAAIMGNTALADPTSSAVVAKATGDAVIVWQATNEVAALLKTSATNDAVLKQLEKEALEIMRSKLPAISPSARSLAVKVIYARTAGVSPVYNSVTFSGFEHLFTLRATQDALKSSKAWDESSKDVKLPAGISVNVTGQLPPR